MTNMSLVIFNKFHDLELFKLELENNIKSLDRQYHYVDINNKAVHEMKISKYFSKILVFLKKLIKKAIKIIITICKKIVLLIYNAINFIINKIKKIFSSQKNNIPFKITFSNGKTIYTKDSSSFTYGLDLFIDNAKSINKLINTYKDMSIDIVNNMERTLETSLSQNNSIITEQVVLYYDTFQIKDNTNNPIASIQGSSLIDEVLLENLASISLDKLDDVLKEIESSQKSINDIIRYLVYETESELINFTLYRVPFYLKIEDTLLGKNVIHNDFIRRFIAMFAENAKDPDMLKTISSNFQSQYFFSFPENVKTDDEKREFIQKSINLTISKYNAIVEQLQNILRLNFSSLYINYLAAKKEDIIIKNEKRTIKTLPNNINMIMPSSNIDIIRFNELLKFNLDSYIHYDGQLIELGDLNLGSIIIADEVIKKNKILQSFLELDYSTKIFPYTTKFDISIITHGYGKSISLLKYYKDLKSNSNIMDYDLFNNLYHNEIVYIEKLTNKSFNEINGNEIIDIDLRKLSINNSFIINHNGISKRICNNRIPSQIGSKISIKVSDIKTNRWVISPIFTPYRKGPFIDMECLIYQLILEGYQTINSLVCNPAGIIFDNKVFTNDDVYIAISTTNLFS